jgi:hypothetical protein
LNAWKNKDEKVAREILAALAMAAVTPFLLIYN